MFSLAQLKDIQIMIEYYRDKAAEDSVKPTTTESAKRMYAREVLKADEFLSLIRRHVNPFEVARDEDGYLPPYGSDGRGSDLQSV